MDRISKEKRSKLMSKIRGKNTSIEISLRKALSKNGIRGYRLHKRACGIRVDLAFVGKKVAVFSDGCFWHGCPKCFKAPKSRVEYWGPKIAANIARDSKNTKKLEAEGWTVLRFWEHDFKNGIDAIATKVRHSIPDSTKKIKASIKNQTK